MKPETVVFTQTVEIADVDGMAIREGSVLQHVEEGERGVVRRIVRVGDMGTLFDCVGDVQIWTSPGSTRVTNNYKKWRHIPHNDQTHEERYISWLSRKYDHDLSINDSLSPDEGLAIDGIMALLPDDIVDWDYGPTPDTITAALGFLVQHLTDLKKP